MQTEQPKRSVCCIRAPWVPRSGERFVSPLRIAGCLWAGAGRSAETRARADAVGLDDIGSLDDLVVESVDRSCRSARRCSASSWRERVAGRVSRALPRRQCGVTGDSEVDRELFDGQATFVDGGIIGPPPTQPGTTRCTCLVRPHAAAELFAGSDLEVRVVDGGPGAASAVKMCFAGWTKGTSALLFALRALAEAEGVTEALLGEWETSMPELITRSDRSPATIGPKAWRFEPEMHEIADSFASAGLPDGFHRGSRRDLRPYGRTSRVGRTPAVMTPPRLAK